MRQPNDSTKVVGLIAPPRMDAARVFATECAAGACGWRSFKRGAGGNPRAGSTRARHRRFAGIARMRGAQIHYGLIEVGLLTFER